MLSNTSKHVLDIYVTCLSLWAYVYWTQLWIISLIPYYEYMCKNETVATTTMFISTDVDSCPHV